MANKNTMCGGNLKKIRLHLEMSRDDFGARLGISPYSIRSWENSIRPISGINAREISYLLLRELNYFCPFEWILGEPTAYIFGDIDKTNISKEVEFFKSLNYDSFVIEVDNGMFMPIAKIKDKLGFINIGIKEINNYSGELILVKEKNLQIFFGILCIEEESIYIKNNLEEKLFIKADSTFTLSLLIWIRKNI